LGVKNLSARFYGPRCMWHAYCKRTDCLFAIRMAALVYWSIYH